MAILDDRGLVDDGKADLVVGGSAVLHGAVTTTGSLTMQYQKFATVTLAGSGNVSIPNPGFYFVPATGASGMSYFTGSVPSAGLWPGSSLLLCETQGNWTWMVTGSAFASTKPVFVAPPTIISGTNTAQAGTRIIFSKGASANFVSDGYYWLMNAGTGSMTFSGFNG